MRWAFGGAVAIVPFDIVMAVGALSLGFEYAHPVGLLVSIAIMAIPAFMATRDAGRLRDGIAVGAVIALADATLGWAVAWIIGPGRIESDDATPPLVMLTGVIVVALGALTGLVAGLAALRVRRHTPNHP